MEICSFSGVENPRKLQSAEMEGFSLEKDCERGEK
jgi:hypothetical protein